MSGERAKIYALIEQLGQELFYAQNTDEDPLVRLRAWEVLSALTNELVNDDDLQTLPQRLDEVAARWQEKNEVDPQPSRARLATASREAAKRVRLALERSNGHVVE